MLRTANALALRGHQVEIFAMSWQGDLPNANMPGANVKVNVLPQKAWFNYQRYQAFIEATFAQINAQKNKVAFDYIFGYNRMAGLDAHFAADPCFIERMHRQRSFLSRLTPRYKWFQRCEEAIFSSQSNTQILAVSLAEMPHFQHRYGTQQARFHYIPPFLSPVRFQLQDKNTMRAYLRQAFGFGGDDFVVMLTGSGFAMKGLDRAIAALAALPAADLATTRLIAVGQDNPKEFNALAQKLGVAAHVIISAGRTDIPQLMQGADVCVHPAYRENTGLVILEGMACGAPMLVTASCGYAHFVAEANAGLVCESPFNQANFNALFAEMRHSNKKAEWAANGLQLARQLLQKNDGNAEADILIKLASAKIKP